MLLVRKIGTCQYVINEDYAWQVGKVDHTVKCQLPATHQVIDWGYCGHFCDEHARLAAIKDDIACYSPYPDGECACSRK
jgi:hypothetical protein